MNAIMGLIALLGCIASGVLSTLVYLDLYTSSGLSNSEELAQEYIFISVVIGWTIVAMCLAEYVRALIMKDLTTSNKNVLSYAFIGLIVFGVLGTLAYHEMNTSSNESSFRSDKEDILISFILSFSIAGLVLIGGLFTLYKVLKDKKNMEEEEAIRRRIEVEMMY